MIGGRIIAVQFDNFLQTISYKKGDSVLSGIFDSNVVHSPNESHWVIMIIQEE